MKFSTDKLLQKFLIILVFFKKIAAKTKSISVHYFSLQAYYFFGCISEKRHLKEVLYVNGVVAYEICYWLVYVSIVVSFTNFLENWR